MILDIPAVASMEGDATSLTWVEGGVYLMSGGPDLPLRIPGYVASGTITPSEDFVQVTTGWTVAHAGDLDGEYLACGVPTDASVFDPNKNLIGQNGAVFTPTGYPYIAPNACIYVNPAQGNSYYIPAQHLTTDGKYFTVQRNHPRQGATLKVLVSVAPTFDVPRWARSFTVKNISGAVAYIRPYIPNHEGNVIDTVAATFGEDGIVGQQMADGQVFSYSQGDFSAGTSFAMCATASAANGAIVDFNA